MFFLQNSSLLASLTVPKLCHNNTTVNLSRIRKCLEERLIGAYGQVSEALHALNFILDHV